MKEKEFRNLLRVSLTFSLMEDLNQTLSPIIKKLLKALIQMLWKHVQTVLEPSFQTD